MWAKHMINLHNMMCVPKSLGIVVVYPPLQLKQLRPGRRHLIHYRRSVLYHWRWAGRCAYDVGWAHQKSLRH